MNRVEFEQRERMDQVLGEVRIERRRQIEKKGWNETHDDEHDDGALAQAAAAYAYADTSEEHALAELWPWDEKYFRQEGHRENCIKALALLCAEVERIDRSK